MTLLEKKLKSVDGLEPGQLAPEASATTITTTSSEIPTDITSTEAAALEGDSNGGEEATEQAALSNNNSGLVKASEHETYGRFFKMVKMGVIELAVKQKMQAEGLDPSVLDKGPDTLLEP